MAAPTAAHKEAHGGAPNATGIPAIAGTTFGNRLAKRMIHFTAVLISELSNGGNSDDSSDLDY